jgi:hypothetical protein
MARWIDRIAERWMRKAEAEGKLSGLTGEGAPLPDRPGDAFVDPGDAIGFRIMAEAGVLPEEIVLNKLIAAQKKIVASETDPARRKEAIAELARLEMKRAIAQESRSKFLKS